jgi:hypothetical protein
MTLIAAVAAGGLVIIGGILLMFGVFVDVGTQQRTLKPNPLSGEQP